MHYKCKHPLQPTQVPGPIFPYMPALGVGVSLSLISQYCCPDLFSFKWKSRLLQGSSFSYSSLLLFTSLHPHHPDQTKTLANNSDLVALSCHNPGWLWHPYRQPIRHTVLLILVSSVSMPSNQWHFSFYSGIANNKNYVHLLSTYCLLGNILSAACDCLGQYW